MLPPHTRHLVWPLLLVAVCACRDSDPVAQVAADARSYFECEEVEVRYAGAYERAAGNDDSSEPEIELYEAISACGGAATYRCEIYDAGDASIASCCRFGDTGCDA